MSEEKSNVIRDIPVKLAVAARPIKRDAFNRLQSRVEGITVKSEVIIIDLQTEVKYVVETDKDPQVSIMVCTDETVGLMLTLNPVNRTFFIPVELQYVQKLDASLYPHFHEERSNLIINSNLKLSTEDKLMGTHTTTTNWPSDFVSASWVVIEPDS